MQEVTSRKTPLEVDLAWLRSILEDRSHVTVSISIVSMFASRMSNDASVRQARGHEVPIRASLLPGALRRQLPARLRDLLTVIIPATGMEATMESVTVLIDTTVLIGTTVEAATAATATGIQAAAQGEIITAAMDLPAMASLPTSTRPRCR